MKLIALVKNEIDLDKLRSDSDGAVVEYISNAIHHCYIALSKARCRIRDNETVYDRETFVELLEDNLQYAEIWMMGCLWRRFGHSLQSGNFCASV